MNFRTWRRRAVTMLVLWAVLAGCTSSRLDPHRVEGHPMMVSEGGQPRLWLLTRQEEVRQVSVGATSRRTGGWRTDTFFHFDLQAFDPETVRPLWKKRLLTLGDAEAQGRRPSRVIGSSAYGRLLGQDGDVVWLLIDEQPWAVNVADGQLLADAAGLEARNPGLKGILPSDGSHYGFDQGLVLMSADARRFVVRGPELEAAPYVARLPPTPEPELRANGRERIVPMMPIGDVPARQVVLEGQWLGLYSEKEAADAANDAWGDKLRYPYSITNEGAQVRRHFWHGSIVSTERFEESFDRLADLVPVADAPSYLKGRFVKNLATGQPLLMESPAGVLVWHSTRIDSEGRLALTRLDTSLRELWTTELPLSESSTGNPVMYWQLPDRLVVMGEQWSVDDGVQLRQPFVATVQFADGKRQGWNLREEAALP